KIPASDTRSQPQPAGGQHANKVSAGKDQYIARDPPDTLNDSVGPRADLFRRFSPRAAVAKQIPAWVHSKNFGRSQCFVFPVVPLHQVRIGDGPRSKSR